MGAPLVSIVVPTYNRAYCLPRTIDSALTQTYAPVEVIVVDDGSKDDTAAVVQARYGSDARVRMISQPNAGVAVARNTGMTAARGDYVALLDSDDVWQPWKLELQVACMRAHPTVGMTWSDMEAVDPDDQVTDRAYLRRMYSAYRWFPTSEALFRSSVPLAQVVPALAPVAGDRRFFEGDLSSAIVTGNLVHTSTVLLTRERMERAGPFNSRFRRGGEDYDFHLRTCRAGPVGFLDIASIRYQRGLPDRITRDENDIHFATAFLETIMPIIEREKDTMRLPAGMIDAVLAEAHGWIGEASLNTGEGRRALKHLALSIRHQPRQPRLLGLMLVAAVPRPLRAPLRSIYRSLKHKVQGRGALQEN